MMWRILHTGVAATWGILLITVVFEIATTGNLSQQAHAAGRFDTSFVMFMTLLLSATFVSSVRAHWLELIA